MGFIKDAKAAAVGTDAKKAWDEGATFFTPVLNYPGFRGGISGRIADWELMIAAIVEVGWRMHTWSVASDNQGRPQAMPLFDRP